MSESLNRNGGVRPTGSSSSSSSSAGSTPQVYEICTAEAISMQETGGPLCAPEETGDRWGNRVVHDETKRRTDENLPYHGDAPSLSLRHPQTSRPITVNTRVSQTATEPRSVYPSATIREARLRAQARIRQREAQEEPYYREAYVPNRTAEGSMRANLHALKVEATLAEFHRRQLIHLREMSEEKSAAKSHRSSPIPGHHILRRKPQKEKPCPNKHTFAHPGHKDDVSDPITPDYLFSLYQHPRPPLTPPNVHGQDAERKHVPTKTLPNPEYQSRPTPSLGDVAASWFPALKARRARKLFNETFSFSASSKRREADWTPQVSPKTSVANSVNIATATAMREAQGQGQGQAQMKRQRVDSSSPAGDECRKKREEEGERRRSTMTPRSPVIPRATMLTGDEDMHPGRRVSFTRRSDPVLEEYHAFLVGHRSLSHDRLGTERKTSLDEVRGQHKDCGPVSHGRRCHLERVERTSRKTAPTSSSTRESSGVVGGSSSVRSSSGSGERSARSGSGEKCPSSEAALKTIREIMRKRSAGKGEASVVAARKEKHASYGVFADEDEKGFLGEGKF